MAGRVVVSTLNDDTGVLAVQNGMTGIAKAWASFNGATAAIRGSFNVSSITRTTTGSYTISFTTAMANANYSVAGLATTIGGEHTLVDLFANDTSGGSPSAPTTSSFIIGCVRYNGAAWQDPTYVSVAVFSS